MTLIDADKLKEQISVAINSMIEGDETEEELKLLGLIKATLDAAVALAPTVEAEPVIHAHWIPQYVSSRGNTDTFSCSECNANSYTTHMVKSCHYKYCRNCGAKMDGKEEG